MTKLIDVSIFKRNHAFSLLYSGQFISFIGTMMTMVALPFQIYSATHSTVMVGLLSLVQLLPLLITALLGGVLADRHSRRIILMCSDGILSVCCLVLAWNASLTTPNIGVIFVLASFMSAITGLHRPSFEGLIQQMVADEDYKTVGALHAFQFSFCMIVGPAIAGILISALGVALTYWFDFFTFAYAVINVWRLKSIPTPTKSAPISIFAALKEGIHFAWSRPVLWGSYCVDFIAMVFAMPNALFPAIAPQLGGVKTLGLLYAAPAVGSLIISIWSGWTADIKHEGRAIALSAITWGIAMVAFGWSQSLIWALFFLACAGAADAASGIFRVSLWNHIIPEEFRGRLAGIEMLSYLSGPKAGDMRAGLMAKYTGIGPAIISGGVLCVLGVSACCFHLREFWAYKTEKKR